MILLKHRALALFALLLTTPLVLMLSTSWPSATGAASKCPAVPASEVLVPEALLGSPDVVECDLVGVAVQLHGVDQTVDIPPPGERSPSSCSPMTQRSITI